MRLVYCPIDQGHLFFQKVAYERDLRSRDAGNETWSLFPRKTIQLVVSFKDTKAWVHSLVSHQQEHGTPGKWETCTEKPAVRFLAIFFDPYPRRSRCPPPTNIFVCFQHVSLRNFPTFDLDLEMPFLRWSQEFAQTPCTTARWTRSDPHPPITALFQNNLSISFFWQSDPRSPEKLFLPRRLEETFPGTGPAICFLPIVCKRGTDLWTFRSGQPPGGVVGVARLGDRSWDRKRLGEKTARFGSAGISNCRICIF